MLNVRVLFESGEEETHTSAKTSLMVGRAPSNDVAINADGVSRYHARLTVEDGEVVIEDLDSTNGTYVNSEQVARHVLRVGDKIAVGNAVLIVSLEEESSAEEPDEAAASPSSTQFGAPEAVEAVRAPAQSSAPRPEAASDAEAEGDHPGVKDEFYWKSLQSFLHPVWPYVLDDSVSEIMINGPEEIFIERKGELHRVAETFSEDQLNAAVLNIAQFVGRRVSEQEPYLDARLPDGSRVAVLMPPCSRKGTAIA
ncbi:MAG: Flp pilus assembly complex ATPase component TadA, partial [Bdellovibrionales bacterium]|nr:Flp pilus assembly complex ATPase component TadA [Bdellovibrionales bacterium]